MTTKELNHKKNPIVTIDKSLEKFKDRSLFQDKVDKANEVLRRVGLPRKKKKSGKHLPKKRVSS